MQSLIWYKSKLGAIGGSRMILKITFLTLLLVLSSASFAQNAPQDRRPISSISDAAWEEYKDIYSSSPLCSKEEITLWSCKASRKTYVLCSSMHISKVSGYIQYKVAKNGKTIFSFPGSKIPPFGLFSYQSSANGDASLEFSNGGYDYSLIDPLRGRSLISVVPKKSPNRLSQISCNEANQTLQVNYTMRLMFDAGIWSDY